MALNGPQKVEIGVRTVLLLCVLSLTGLRLYARGHTRWRWDDAWVSFGCVWLVVHSLTSMQVPLRYGKEDSTQHLLFFLSYFGFECMIWSARLSILASIIRITPSAGDRKRRQIIFIVFVFMCFIELAQLSWLCITNTKWNPARIPQCFGYKRIIIFHLISSVLSDSVLLIIPLSTLRTLKSSAPRIRTRLSLAFVASACTTILSVVTCLLILVARDYVNGYISSLEGCVSLVVCNLPVLVVAACHVLGIRDCSRSDDTLPPIEFAPRRGDGGNPIPISTAGAGSPQTQTDTQQSRSFFQTIASFTVGVQDDEDECDAESKRFCQTMLVDQVMGPGKVLMEMGKLTEEETRRVVPVPRRHSMHI